MDILKIKCCLALILVTFWVFMIKSIAFEEEGEKMLVSSTAVETKQDELVIHVSCHGNDLWSGRLPEPNDLGTDGPLGSLEGARDAIRKIKNSNAWEELRSTSQGINVILSGGIYQLPDAFELHDQDSGEENIPIVYSAELGQEVRLVGGRIVTDFEPVSDPEIRNRLQPKARDHIRQTDLGKLGINDFGQAGGGGLELFFADRPMTLSRWPNEEFIKITGLVGDDPVDVRGTKGDKIGKFMYQSDRPEHWRNENDVWVHGYWFWDWSEQRHAVESIDTENRIISVKPPYHGYGYRTGQWFYAFNILAELDQPGQWYLDRKTSLLYFWPPSSLEESQVAVSVIKTMVKMENVSHVTLKGFIFEAAREHGVLINGGESNRLVGCTFRNLGGWAVQISGGSKTGVQSCDIYQTGKGGISLSGGDRVKLQPAQHYAVNNHIHHYSRWDRVYQPAVSLNGVGNRAAHNLIHHAPHMAIGFSGNNHLIEFNEIHHVCYESNDAGAIYCGRDWTMRGTIIRHNFLHHINGFEGRGCVGVYLDDMFSGTSIYGNLFYQVTRAAFIGGGRDCKIENNIFVDCNPALHIDARAMGWASYHVNQIMKERLMAMPYQDQPWTEQYPELVDIWKDEPAAPKGNLVANNIAQKGTWDGVQDQARPYVTFQQNLVDQLPESLGGDKPDQFQLASDSAAYNTGFQPIPVEKIGLYIDKIRVSLPTQNDLQYQ